MHAETVYTRPNPARQFELGLADRDTHGLLSERLAAIIEELNAHTDLPPGEVVGLKAEADRLRAILHPPSRATVAAKGGVRWTG